MKASRKVTFGGGEGKKSQHNPKIWNCQKQHIPERKIFERGREKERSKNIRELSHDKSFCVVKLSAKHFKFKALQNWFSSSYNKTYTYTHTLENTHKITKETFFPSSSQWQFYSNKNSIYFSIMAKAFHFQATSTALLEQQKKKWMKNFSQAI